MNTSFCNESTNTEREKANLLCLMKLTLNTLIDQSSSTVDLLTLDDRNLDVTNFIITLERVLCLRMKANWLSERRFFWDFIRPACISSCQQSIIERVEEVSRARSLKEKGRAWIKFALMEKKLSELLKIVISDSNLVRKYYHDDSIMTSPQAFILCDQLAGLSAIDFSFCFKQEGFIISPILLNDSEIDVIDLTPFLSYTSRHMKPILVEQTIDDENQQQENNREMCKDSKSIHSSSIKDMIPLDKHKLEVEQRKYFEELLQHRDRELQQIKARYDAMKHEHEREILQMENIILELQTELRTAREEVETKRKKSQRSGSTTPPKESLNGRKIDSPTTPTNDGSLSNMISLQSNEFQTNDGQFPPSQSSRRSSHSTTTTNTDDDQYEAARKLELNNDSRGILTMNEMKPVSSPELLSSAASLSSASSFCDETEQNNEELTIISGTNENETNIDQIQLNEGKYVEH